MNAPIRQPPIHTPAHGPPWARRTLPSLAAVELIGLVACHTALDDEGAHGHATLTCRGWEVRYAAHATTPEALPHATWTLVEARRLRG